MPTPMPYGTWASPVRETDLAEGVRDIGFPAAAGEDVFWVETERGEDLPRLRRRPADGNGPVVDALPPGHGTRSGLNGYGAMPYALHHTPTGTSIAYVDHSDGGLWLQRPGGAGDAVRLTAPGAGRVVLGGPQFTPDGRAVVCVRERGGTAEAVHEIIAVSTDADTTAPVVLARGHDFYGTLCVHPDGDRVVAVVWDHPHMPWDRSVLAEFRLDGSTPAGRPIAPAHTPVGQPRFSPQGVLHFLADQDGWSNLHTCGPDGTITAQPPVAADLGRPEWTCGLRTYDFLPDGTVLAAARHNARDALLRIATDGAIATVPTAIDVIDMLTVSAAGPVVVGGSPTRERGLVAIGGMDFDLRAARTAPLPPEWTSPAQLTLVPSGDVVLSAQVYPPVHPTALAPDRPPPAIVWCHGGPTVEATGLLDHRVQFWTTRGIAFVEVNYRGSSGHGRAFREAINGRWGVADVQDCLDAVDRLAAAGTIDRDHVIVAGLSSGGFTALGVAAHHGAVAGVISISGVADATAVPATTHKIEKHYLDTLIGPWPAWAATYRERSPVSAVAWSTPALLVHGAADDVVDIGQVRALSRRLAGLATGRGDVELLEFPDEGHGISRPRNLARLLTAQLAFAARVLGFEPAGPGP